MADKKLNIKVGLKGHKKAEKGLGKLDSRMKGLGSTALKLGGTFFAAQGIIRGFSTVIKLAGEQEQAEKRLETALGHTSNALLKQASALQKVTTFGDESIIGVQASIAAFVDSEEQIKKATEATLDIAVAMGMDLKSAGDLVAKTLGSSTNAMSRYGIQVEGAVGSTERLESLTGNVAKLFGGQAKAQAETMAGAMEQAKNASGDLAEKIGEKLSPLVKALANDFKRTAENLSELIDPTVLSREEQLSELLRERSVIMGEHLEAMNDEAITVDELFNLWEETGGISKEALDIGLEGIKEEIKAFNDLIFAQKESLRIRREEKSLLEDLKKVKVSQATTDMFIAQQKGKAKKEQMILDMKGAALSGQTALQSMKSVVRAETMEAVAGYLASILKTVPFPANLILAAGAGGAVAGLMDKALGQVPNKFAQGGIVPGQGTGDTVPAMLTPGEVILNKAQQENLVQGMGNITLNISAPLVDETIIDTIIPAIQKAQRMNLA